MPTVLLVDDAFVFKAVEGTCLRREPCRLVMAAADAVLDRVAADSPDLLIASVTDDDSRVWLLGLSRDTRLEGLPMIVLDFAGASAGPIAARAPEAAPVDVLRVPGGSEGPDFGALDPLLDAAIKHRIPSLSRRPDRVAVSLPVWCEGGGVHATLKTKNLSASGLFLKTERPLAPGERLDVRFSLPVEGMARVPIAGVCEVVRRVQAAGPPGVAEADLIPGVGVRFLELPEEGMKILRHYVSATTGGATASPAPGGRSRVRPAH